ncbi:MAG: tetratricopeptide repeat protein [Bacteroidia bacterium]|nr:tetratricopeptide repeat protein [Bacteroidia bacterium]
MANQGTQKIGKWNTENQHKLKRIVWSKITYNFFRRVALSTLLIWPTLIYAQKKSKQRNLSANADTNAWRGAAPAFTRGVVLFTQGLIEEAADFLEKAAELSPNSAGIHYYLARIAYAQGDPIRMLTHAEKAYLEAPQEIWTVLGYAAALQLNSQTKEACELLEKLLKSHPDHPEILFRLAQAYQAQGDIDKADAYYARFQHLTGSYEETFQARVHLFVEKGHTQRAIALAESLATLFPRHEVYLETAVRLYELNRDLKGMASAAGRLLEIDPANQVGWEVVLGYPELFEEIWGEESWERFLEAPGVPVEIKYALLRRVDFLEDEEFLAILRRLLAEAPTASGWELYARYWAHQERWDSAARAWRSAIALDSTQVSLYGDYFYALYRLGGGDSLLREVQRARELIPGQGRFYLWEAIALTLNRSPEMALPLFQKGWRLLQPLDTPLAQIASYYHAIAEITTHQLSIQTRQKLLTLYKPPIGEVLLEILTTRRGERHKSPNRKEGLPLVYESWLNLVRDLQANRFTEAYAHAAKAVRSGQSLPLEMWEDILLSLGEKGIGPDYNEWKQQAQKTYPLAILWRDLP